MTPDQNALFDAALAAYDATGLVYYEAYSTSEFITDLGAAQDTDAVVAS